MLLQLREGFGLAASLQIAGAGTDARLDVGDLADDETRIRQARDAKGEVVALVDASVDDAKRELEAVADALVFSDSREEAQPVWAQV